MTILFLTFYFEPDIGPGAFRNTAFVRELARQLGSESSIHVITTQPNRYQSYKPLALGKEVWTDGHCPVTIERIPVPAHNSGFMEQIHSFWAYYRAAHQLTRNRKYDLVVASSSRLFTAYLGAQLARKQKRPLFLDIRDLFRETILEVLHRSPTVAVLNACLRAVEAYTFGYASHINLVSEGFRSYFGAYSQATYSYFTNGIDDTFLVDSTSAIDPTPGNQVRLILYAGNIGKGQGLHTIIPQAARLLGDRYRFVVVGSGGARYELETALRLEKVDNVELYDPVSRTELLEFYRQADYLFLHLNNLKACERVLPSKLIEYGASDKPIIAGVSGYAASFVREHLTNYILFEPGDVDALVRQVHETSYVRQTRTRFREQFRRTAISQAMARQLLKTGQQVAESHLNVRP